MFDEARRGPPGDLAVQSVLNTRYIDCSTVQVVAFDPLPIIYFKKGYVSDQLVSECRH